VLEVQPPKPDPHGRRQGQKPASGGPEKKVRVPLWYIFVGIVLILAIQSAKTAVDQKKIEYSEFKKLLSQGRIQRVLLHPNRIEGELKPTGGDEKPGKFVTSRVEGDEKLIELLEEQGVSYDQKSDWLKNLLLFWVLPIGLILILWKFLFSRMGPAGEAMRFGQSRARLIMQKDVDVTFDEVAGIDESKEELREIVEFLKDPGRFTRLGGKIPKGVMLVGAPGTGKTLLAKAVAGEAGVPFFSLSGSDFVEMFVGVGAARVRDLFEQANSQAPSIIFIDELEAVGKARGMGVLGGHDEREQTLNALLVEMDGMESSRGVIILAATNRPETLDPALLRPGRFDRHIVVPRPDLNGREQILRVHVKGVRLADSVDLRKVAAMTPGFVGADIANLVNESALLAARKGKEEVEMADFEEAIERVVAGLEKRNRLMNEEEKRIIAHHESGHALIACLVKGADPVRKISMIPRGVAALGYTMQMPVEDRYLLKKSELLDRLAVMLGGRAAEEVVFDEVSTGAQNDLQRASELAWEMVTSYGMSEELGPLAFPSDSAQVWQVGQAHRPWSERTNREIDVATKRLVEEAYERSKRLLTEHKEVLLRIASALLEKEVLEEDELREILKEFGLQMRGAEPEKDRTGDAVAPPDEASRPESPGTGTPAEGGA